MLGKWVVFIGVEIDGTSPLPAKRLTGHILAGLWFWCCRLWRRRRQSRQSWQCCLVSLVIDGLRWPPGSLMLVAPCNNGGFFG